MFYDKFHVSLLGYLIALSPLLPGVHANFCSADSSSGCMGVMVAIAIVAFILITYVLRRKFGGVKKKNKPARNPYVIRTTGRGPMMPPNPAISARYNNNNRRTEQSSVSVPEVSINIPQSASQNIRSSQITTNSNTAPLQSGSNTITIPIYSESNTVTIPLQSESSPITAPPPPYSAEERPPVYK